MEDEEKESFIDIPKSEEYTERLISNIVVSRAPEGFFVLDFLRPDASVYAEEESGKIKGLRGKNVSDVRVFTSPQTAKRALIALEEQIENYEEEFGEVKT